MFFWMPDMTTAVLEYPGGSLTLTRPGTKDPSLRAWSAADELLLQEAFEYLTSAPDARVLVVDDQYGALTLGLSALDRKSTRLNSSHVRTSYAVFCLKKKNRTS